LTSPARHKDRSTQPQLSTRITSAAANGAAPAVGRGYRLPEDGPLPDLSLYERLISDGTVATDAQNGLVDTITAQRLSIWLAARLQPAVFSYTNRPQAARLMNYCVARSAELGPVGENFAAACDQIDRVDAILAGLRYRARHGQPLLSKTWPDIQGPEIVVLVDRDSGSQRVALILDATTANASIFAITAHVDDREAHIREAGQLGQSFPAGSYGRGNRQAIAARETPVATRLGAVEYAYRTAIEREALQTPPEPARTPASGNHAADRQVDFEADP
jgi:hypothetical protein